MPHRERGWGKNVEEDVCGATKLLVCLFCVEVVCRELPSQQVSAMTSIYEIIRNDSSPSFVWRNFSKNSNPCLWKGVGCSSDHSSLINITFTRFWISTSEFLPFVCNITTLEPLDVSYNHLQSIPDSFLSGCGNISGLKHLNNLYGPLPSFKGFKMLESLYFSHNSLSGEIGQQLDGLVSLKALDLGFNLFTGRIPTNLRKMELLEHLLLDNNSFTGLIPGEWAELTRLWLSSNHLSGTIPAWISNITTFREFLASDNYLNGTIPSGITSHLTHFVLGGNMLTGTIPSDLLSSPYFEILDLSNNELEGRIPATNDTIPWGSFGSLVGLDMDNNRLTGSLPPGLGNYTNIRALNLQWNDFSGEIPPEMSRLNLLIEVRISWNSLSGSIPHSISKMQNITHLDLEGNNLRGPIPESIGNLSSLMELHLGNNQLSRTIPDMPESLIDALNLSFNHFHGNIPLSLSKLARLQVLDLQGNNLSGSIPNNIRNLSSLLELQLGNNQLSGRIPYMPEKLQNTLNLSYNLFSGPIPDTLSNLWQLEVLDLSNNEFSGQIPDFLTRFSGLTHLLLMNNNLSGVVPRFRNDVKVDTWGNNFATDLISPAQSHRKKKPVHSDFGIATACGFPVGLLISIIAIFISRRYHSVHGSLSPPNTIHTPTIDFNKAMKAVSHPSNITLKARFSTFYKVVMPSDTTYLVNKFSHSNNIIIFPRHKELVEELEILGELSHTNVMNSICLDSA